MSVVSKKETKSIYRILDEFKIQCNMELTRELGAIAFKQTVNESDINKLPNRNKIYSLYGRVEAAKDLQRLIIEATIDGV